MRWSEISARQPALGVVADRLLIEPGVLLAGTIRRDGTARISGVEPLVLDGDLQLSMMSGSAKSRDLGRDPRIVLNSVITSPSPPAEIKVRGRARAVTGQDQQEQYADSPGYWRERLGRNLIQATMATTTSSQGENRRCRTKPRTIRATMAARTRAMMAGMVIGFL